MSDQNIDTNMPNDTDSQLQQANTDIQNQAQEDPSPASEPTSVGAQILKRRTLLGRITGIGDSPASPEAPNVMSVIAAIINGGGIGLLLGMLMGLTDKPVVAGIITTLSGLLTLLLGVNEIYITILKGIRIGAFGVFCVAGVLWGLDIRTNNGLLPSREKMMEEYTKIGFTKQEALDFIAYREFQIIPRGWKQGALASPETKEGDSTGDAEPGEEPKNTSSQQVAENSNARVFADANATGAERKSVLYSSEIDAGACYILDLANENQPASEIKNTFEEAGGTWKELAQNLGAGLPEKVYIHALLTTRDCFCESGQSGKLKITNCETVNKITSNDPLEKIKSTLASSGQTWKTIETKIGREIPETYQKTVFLSLIKIFCHD